jgi:transcriptional regulator with XRE-family HTH domain
MDRMTPAELARVLALLRVAKGWTKKELAAVSGMPAYRLTAIETGKRVPQLFALYDLLVSMGYRMDAIERTWTYLRELRANMGPERRTTRATAEVPRPVRYRAAR